MFFEFIGIGTGTMRLIVYFTSRREVVYAHRWCRARLLQHGFTVAQVEDSTDAMHAIVSSAKKQQVVLRFMVLVITVLATNAFGMGVNNPGVFCVVYWGLPRTLEELLQMWGRAGRQLDRKCFGIIFYATVQGTLHGIKPTQLGAARPAHMSLRLGLMSFLAYGGCLAWKIKTLMGSPVGTECTAPHCTSDIAGCVNCEGHVAFLQFPCDVDVAISAALCIMTKIRSGSAEEIISGLLATRTSSRSTGFFPEMGCGAGMLSRPDWRLLVLCMVGQGFLQSCVIDAAQSWPPVLEISQLGRLWISQHPFQPDLVLSNQGSKPKKRPKVIDLPPKVVTPASQPGFWKRRVVETTAVLRELKKDAKVLLEITHSPTSAHLLNDRPIRAASDKKVHAKWLCDATHSVTTDVHALAKAHQLRNGCDLAPKSVLLAVLSSLKELNSHTISA